MKPGAPRIHDFRSRAEAMRELESCIEALAGDGDVRIDYDHDYGTNHRRGWSVHVAGSCVVQFAPTLNDSLVQAVLAVKAWE